MAEPAHRRRFLTRGEARTAIFDCMGSFYSRTPLVRFQTRRLLAGSNSLFRGKPYFIGAIARSCSHNITVLACGPHRGGRDKALRKEAGIGHHLPQRRAG
jgi:hypothetical protein